MTKNHFALIQKKQTTCSTLYADDSLPDDEELAPLSEIEQVKGELDQGPFHTEFQTLAQSREEDMLPPSGAPFNPECNNFIFTIISINLMPHIQCIFTATLHTFALSWTIQGKRTQLADCCRFSAWKIL